MKTFIVLGLVGSLVSSGAPYPLDHISRETPTTGKVRCNRDALTRYAGATVPFHRKVTIHPAFMVRIP